MTDELEQMSPNQRRALNKALSALEAFASIWAVEICLSELSARIALLPDEAERAKRIAAMIEQGFIEGAYRHYLDHKDKCDEIAATRDTALQAAQKDAHHIEAQSVRDAVIEECAMVCDAQGCKWFDQGEEDRGTAGSWLREELRLLKSAPPQKPVSDEVKP